MLLQFLFSNAKGYEICKGQNQNYIQVVCYHRNMKPCSWLQTLQLTLHSKIRKVLGCRAAGYLA